MEVKNYGPDNPLVKGEPSFLVERLKAESLNQARRLLAVAGGTPIEWHVSNQKAVDVLRDLFKDGDTRNIKVIFTPDIVN